MAIRKLVAGSVGALCLLGGASSSLAAGAFDANSPYMLGDLGGMRDELAEHGVSLHLSYLNEAARNLHGGYDDHRKSVYSDQTTLMLGYDLNKDWGVDGKWSLAITNRNNGELLSTERLYDPRGPVTNLSQEVWGGGSYTRITHLTYQQNFLDNQFSIRAGRMSPTEEFFPASPYVCDFQSLTNCGTVPGINSIWYGWPVASWGAAGTWRITPDVYVKLGLYQQNPKNNDHSRVMSFKTEGGEGEIVPVLVGWTPRWGDKQYKGNYFAGVFYSNVHTDDVYEGKNGGAQALDPSASYLKRNSRKAAWFYLGQQVSGPGGDSAEGLNVYFNGEINDSETSITHYVVGAGLYYKAPFSSRPNDVVGFGSVFSKTNDRWDKNRQLSNEINGFNDLDAAFAPSVSHEVTTELYYRFQATPWLYLQPNIQHYKNPGSVSSVDDAWVAGFRTGITF